MNADEIKARIAGRRVVASVSGGKDSAAMSLYLRELGIEHDRVFMDTGWEHPATYEYLCGELPRVIGPIMRLSPSGRGLELAAAALLDESEKDDCTPDVPLDRLSLLAPEMAAANLPADSAMVKTVLRKGMFPSKRRRFCTEELKIFPMQAYLADLVASGAEVINAVGIRRAESHARSTMAEWEWSAGFDCEVWRPLILATEADVIALHARHGLRPNPLYLLGASRVGCWPCIYARKAEIRLVATLTPERIDFIRAFELIVRNLALGRYELRLAIFDAGGAAALSPRDRQALLDEHGKVKPFSSPTWFQAPIGDSVECWPIDRVVEWSRTLHGGRVEDKQIELFAQADEGCMRWGLCETAAPDGDER